MAMVDRADATVPDIDVSMQLGASHPMGPLMLADYIGLDTCLNILKGWRKDFPNDVTFFVPECLEKKVAGGNLGRKSGKGFYNWTGDKCGAPVV
jgi:3-hydroxyacyl-CoA dehydrogenase